MWIRGRALRPGRTDDEDEFQLDLSKDCTENVRDILTNICKKQGSTSERKRLSYLNAFVKLITKCEHDYPRLGFTAEEILYCLRPALLHDTTQVRSGGLRALRYMLCSIHELTICYKLQYPLLIARSLDLITGNDNERVQAIRVVRRLLCLDPAQFPVNLARTLVAIASGTEDRLINVALATLAELCILNPELFILVGGVTSVLRSLTSVRSARMAESLVGCLLYLLNKPETRLKAGVNLDCLAAPYTDLQAVDKTKENQSNDRFKWAHISLLSTLRSWPGVLHFCHPFKDSLRSIVATLYLNQLDVRKAVLDLLYELLCLAQPEWSDEMNVALEAVDPSRAQESFKLSEGFVAAEGKTVLPHLSKCRVNLTELHLSLLLFCFLEVGLLDAIVEVIIGEDTFLSVRATILLGELLHLIHLLLPPECCHLTPSLPNLLSYAVRGRPHSTVRPAYNLSSSPPDLGKLLGHSNSDSFTGEDLTSKKDAFTRMGVRSGQSSTRTFSGSSTEKTTKLDTQMSLRSDGQDKRLGNDEGSPFHISGKKVPSDSNLTFCRADKTAHLLKGVRDVLSDMTNTGIGEIKWWSQSHSKDSQKREVEPPACSRAQQRALAAVTALSRLHRLLRLRPAPASLHLDHVLATVAGRTPMHGLELARAKGKTQSKTKLTQVISKECDEAIKDSGVLTNKDCFAWNWDIIRAVLKNRPECLVRCEENNYRQFLRRLVQFVAPSSRQMSRVDFSGDRQTANIYTLTAMELLDCLLLGPEDSECDKLMGELLTGLKVQIEAISSSKSAHDCMFSPQAVLNSLCQDYFLLIGHLSRSKPGCDLLDRMGILQTLLNLATKSKHDCYVKLVISCLDYSSDQRTRNILSSTLVCEQISSRLYTTKFLRILLRTPIKKHGDYVQWVIELLANQLSDENRAVSLSAIVALDEACDCKEYLDALINLRPSLLHLGDKGLLLLIRFLSTDKGFNYMREANFVTTQLGKWVKFNYKYVCIVEGELADGLTLVERNEDGRYSSRLSHTKRVPGDVYVPPHLYGQLACHQAGLNTLLAHENIPKLVQVVLQGRCSSDSEVLDLKAALWALGHLSSCPGGALWARTNNVTRALVTLASSCPVYSVRSTAFHAIALTSTNTEGADTLLALGWHTVRHNRSELWPVVAPLSLLEDAYLQYQEDMRESSESTTTENVTKNGLFILGEDSVLETNDSFIGFTGRERAVRERKSATLPPVGSSHAFHHNRSYSESKADSEWPHSTTPAASNSGSDITDFRSNEIPRLLSESSTSGTSSGGESYQPRTLLSEKLMQTLSPIPSTGSLATVKSHRKISVISSQGPQLSPQDLVGLAALRNLHRSRRPTFFATPHLSLHFSQSAPVSLSPLSPIELIAFQDWKQMSPLVRPKHPDNHPIETQFEVSGVQCPLPSSSEKPQTLHYESSCSCIAQPPYDSLEEDSSGPCFQGICLPQNIAAFFPMEEFSGKTEDHLQDNNSNTGMDLSSCDSETDTAPEGEGDRPKLCVVLKKRHDRSSCLLCSVSRLANPLQPRWRKISASSQHRTRTETESSYGGAGNDGESPVMLPWQSKCGLEGIASVDSSGTDIASVVQRSLGDNFKSRSVVRKEILRLAEQLCNPILYKTCKQALMQLKQIYNDVFNDICVYSDVCSVMASASHRICARRFLQELFLDAPFSEIYEDSLGILNVQCNSENEDGKCLEKLSLVSEPTTEDSNVESSFWKTTSSKNGFDSEQRSGQGFELEVIMESDARSESSDLCRVNGEGRRLSYTQDSQANVPVLLPSNTPSQTTSDCQITVSRSSQQLRKEFFKTDSSPEAQRSRSNSVISVTETETKSSESPGETMTNSSNLSVGLTIPGDQSQNKSSEEEEEHNFKVKSLQKSDKDGKNKIETVKSQANSKVPQKNHDSNSKKDPTPKEGKDESLKLCIDVTSGKGTKSLNTVSNSVILMKKGKKITNTKSKTFHEKNTFSLSKSPMDDIEVMKVEITNRSRENAASFREKIETKSDTLLCKKETSKAQSKTKISGGAKIDPSTSSVLPAKSLKKEETETLQATGKPPSGSNRQRKKATTNVPNKDYLNPQDIANKKPETQKL